VPAASTSARFTLHELSISGPIKPWLDLGFATDHTAAHIHIGSTTLTFGIPEASGGIAAWRLDPDPGVIDGLDVVVGPTVAAQPFATAVHPNGARQLDHVVVMTPHLDRTDAALAAAGFDRRRVRDAGTPERPMWQSFYRLGEVVLEVVGPRPDSDPSPDQLATFWGLVVIVDDLDAMVAQSNGALSAPRAAVQPGRHISTASREANLGFPVAFMDPDPR
jgi:hypothetical protein